MLHAIHTMDEKNAIHKLRLKIFVYHHFVSITPSDGTNREYLKVKDITCNSISDKNNLTLSCPS